MPGRQYPGTPAPPPSIAGARRRAITCSTPPGRPPMTSSMRRRVRSAAAGLVILSLALAGCLPSDGAPGSPGVPVMGQSRVSGAQLAAWYRANAPASLPYRASNIGLDQLADMFVTEGNRYNVRGDIAFAQSVVETGLVQLPRLRPGAAVEQQLLGHRRVRLVRRRLPVQLAARRRARAAPAAPQLRRQRLARARPSRTRRCPSCGGATPRPRRTTSTTTSTRGARRSGT